MVHHLYLFDALFDGVDAHERVDGDGPCLPDAVDAVARLLFPCWVEVHVQLNQVVRSRKVQPHASSQQRKQAYVDARVVVEACHGVVTCLGVHGPVDADKKSPVFTKERLTNLST